LSQGDGDLNFFKRIEPVPGGLWEDWPWLVPTLVLVGNAVLTITLAIGFALAC
jgi:hypothetical protein